MRYQQSIDGRSVELSRQKSQFPFSLDSQLLKSFLKVCPSDFPFLSLSFLLPSFLPFLSSSLPPFHPSPSPYLSFLPSHSPSLLSPSFLLFSLPLSLCDCRLRTICIGMTQWRGMEIKQLLERERTPGEQRRALSINKTLPEVNIEQKTLHCDLPFG